MRAHVLLLGLLLLLPTVIAADERDRAEEVRGGAKVHAYIEYVGGVKGHRTGSTDTYALTKSMSNEVRWEGALTLAPTTPGTLEGSLIGKWHARASSDYDWNYQAEDSSMHEAITCAASDYEAPLAFNVEAQPEPDGLRITVKGYAVPNLNVPGACAWTRDDVVGGERTHQEGARDLVMNIALIHALKGVDYDVAPSFLVPYDGRASAPFTYSSPIPHTSDIPASAYCGMGGGSLDWAKGSCTAAGKLTARTFVDPCGYIARTYAEHHAALANVAAPPAGADEAALRAWAPPNQQKVSEVLGDQRAWMLVGCAGELSPDPWDAIIHVQRMLRDALLELARKGELSPEGIGELLGAERALQLMGAEDDVSFADIPGLTAPAPSGTMQVAVHSPVSLHVVDENGGHVGWNRATNTSVSTIEGATYEGEPGGAQTITLPAGFYKVVVDELAHGNYLLNVTANATAAATEDAFLIKSAPGRTTSTHYAVTTGWGGPRLDTFPVRRAATPDDVAFIDAGRPPTNGGASAPKPPSPSPEPVLERKDGPIPVALAVVGLAAAAFGRRGKSARP